MLVHLRRSAILLGLFTLLTGILYPLAVTGAARALFPAQAGGSLIVANGRVVGSELIGQAFSDPRYFMGRPSATSAKPYDASASGGSNMGPSNPALTDAVRERVASARALGPDKEISVPVDLVTTSASGLDPHISPAAALFQVSRVARARDLPEARVRELVERHVEGRTFGVLGEPRVNVLRLNMALDELVRTGT